MAITELKLVSRNKNDVVDKTPFISASDIDYDNLGRPILCSGTEGLEQNLLKALITSVQDTDGYGTDFKAILGKKNTDFIRVKLMQEILSSLSVLKKYQLDFLSKNPTYDKKSIIGSILNLQISPVSNTEFSIIIKVQSLDDIEKNNQNLQEVKTTISL